MVGGDAWPAVGVEQHEDLVIDAADNRFQRRRQRFEDHAERPGMQDGDSCGQRREVDTRCSSVRDVEAVGGAAVLIELGCRQGRRQLGELHQGVVDVVGQQLTVQKGAEAVTRQRAENATSLPNRPMVRAALNGPPPNLAVTEPSGSITRSTSASPATTIIAVDATPAARQRSECADPMRVRNRQTLQG